MIHFKLFGPTALTRDDGTSARSVLAQPKRLALASYLATLDADVFCRRDTLLELFWPDKDPRAGRHALRQALHFLRKSLGPRAIEARGDAELRLSPDRVRTDVFVFWKAVADGDSSKALDTYAGPFLDGLRLDDCPAFTRWVDDERDRLHVAAWKVAFDAAESAGRSGDTPSALAMARVAVGLRPLHEGSVRAFMRLAAAAGDRPGALEAFEHFRERLASELQTSPDPRTLDLEREIRDEARPVDATDPSIVVIPGQGTRVDRTVRTARVPGRRHLLIGGLTVAALLVAGVGSQRWGAGAPTASDDVGGVDERASDRRVLVLPIRNESGEPELDAVARIGTAWLERRIVEGGVADIVSFSVIAAAVDGDRLVDPSTAAELASADWVVVGEVLRSGGDVVVTTRMVRMPGLETQVGLMSETASASDPMPAFDRAADRVLGALQAQFQNTWPRPLHRPPPSMRVLQLETEAFDAFYATDYARFHVLADSIIAMDSVYFPSRIIGNQAAAYWNRQADDPRNLYLADSVLQYLESRSAELSPDELRGARWLHAAVVGDLDAQMAAVWTLIDGQPSGGKAYQVALSARRTNRLDLALSLIEQRYTMHREASEYRAWDQVHLAALARLRRFDDLLAAARDAQARLPTYGLYLRREVQALAALGRVDEIDDVIERAREYPLTDEFSPAGHLVAAAEALYGEGLRSDALKFARRALAEADAQDESAVPGVSDIDSRPSRANAMVYLGSWSEAADLFGLLASEDIAPNVRLTYLGSQGAAFARAGRSGEARDVIEALQSWEDRLAGFHLAGMARFQQARIHAAMGDRTQAIMRLDAALSSGQVHDMWALWDPYLMALHGDPTYERLVAVKTDTGR